MNLHRSGAKTCYRMVSMKNSTLTWCFPWQKHTPYCFALATGWLHKRWQQWFMSVPRPKFDTFEKSAFEDQGTLGPQWQGGPFLQASVHLRSQGIDLSVRDNQTWKVKPGLSHFAEHDDLRGFWCFGCAEKNLLELGAVDSVDELMKMTLAKKKGQ